MKSSRRFPNRLPLDIGSLLPPAKRREIRSLSEGPGDVVMFVIADRMAYYDKLPATHLDRLKENLR